MKNPENGSYSAQIIDENGNFDLPGVVKFTKQIELAKCGMEYAVVSIMGPQSSGKSTLLNHLFHTNFKEMNENVGRGQTTKGIWIANCTGIKPTTIVLDLEGSDGSERGEDDTIFERQSALFALSVSDIMMINMWCHDIGREHASSKPLLKTIFEVMMRLFKPRKTTLMFVIRDKSITPVDVLESILKRDMQTIWAAVPKSAAHKDTPLSECFNVVVTALPSYEENKEEFNKEVAQLRNRFSNSLAPGGLAGDRQCVVPASELSFSAQEIWKVVKENKELDLPSHKVMVATLRCGQIVNEIYSQFASNESWLELNKSVPSCPIIGFGKILNLLINTSLSQYNFEAIYFDESVGAAKLQLLKEKLLQLVDPAFQAMLSRIRSETQHMFEEELENQAFNTSEEGFAMVAKSCTKSFIDQFDERCQDIIIELADKGDSTERDRLQREMKLLSEGAIKLTKLASLYKMKLKEAISEPVNALLDEAGEGTWVAIRKLLKKETNIVTAEFFEAIKMTKFYTISREKIHAKLDAYGKSFIESKAREEARRVLIHMKKRFVTLFSYDSESMPRIWKGKVDIVSITRTARSSTLKLLSAMAAIRFEDDYDCIEATLFSTLLKPVKRGVEDYPLASNTWQDVPSSKTLITPVKCNSLWKHFKEETVDLLREAQKAKMRTNSWLPSLPNILPQMPSQSTVAPLLVFGFSALLRTPLWVSAILGAVSWVIATQPYILKMLHGSEQSSKEL